MVRTQEEVALRQECTLLEGGELMRTRGEGGLEKIGDIWYFSYINLNGKQVRRSSGSKLKQVAVEMLRKAKEELAKGIAPVDTRKLFYEDLRAILVADYTANGKAEMDGEDLVISGKKGVLKSLDDFFGGMAVQALRRTRYGALQRSERNRMGLQVQPATETLPDSAVCSPSPNVRARSRTSRTSRRAKRPIPGRGSARDPSSIRCAPR